MSYKNAKQALKPEKQLKHLSKGVFPIEDKSTLHFGVVRASFYWMAPERHHHLVHAC